MHFCAVFVKRYAYWSCNLCVRSLPLCSFVAYSTLCFIFPTDWYLKVELENPTYGTRYRDMFSLLEAHLCETEFRVSRTVKPSGQLGESHSSIAPFKSIVDSVSKLGHTFRHGEGDGQRKHHRRTVWDALVAQDKYISGIMDVQLRCRDARGKRDAKESQLKTSLAKEGFDSTINGEVIPLPSTPNVLVNGLTPDTAKMFKSALSISEHCPQTHQLGTSIFKTSFSGFLTFSQVLGDITAIFLINFNRSSLVNSLQKSFYTLDRKKKYLFLT